MLEKQPIHQNNIQAKELKDNYVLDLSDIGQAFLHSWHLVIGTVLLFMLIALTLVFVLPKEWEATATMRIGQIPSNNGELKLIEDPLQTIERIKLQGFKEKVLADLHLPKDKDFENKTDLFVKSLKGNAVPNTDFINLSIRGYSATEAKNSLDTTIKEIIITHTSMGLPSKNRVIQGSQTINERLNVALSELTALKNKMLTAGTYNGSSAFEPSIVAINLLGLKDTDVRTLQDQKVQYDTRLAAFDEHATVLVNTIDVSPKPAFPKRSIFLLIGILFGLFVGTWIAILKYKKILDGNIQ